MERTTPANLDRHESDQQEPEKAPTRWKPKYKMAGLWIGIVAMACCWLVGEVLLGWFLFFSPGWANGWPPPFSYQLVLSTGVTIYSSIMLMTAAAGVGAIVGLILAVAGVSEERERQVYVWWLCFAAVVVLCVGVFVFGWNWNQIGPNAPNLD
jgi:hypothetical protein